MPSFRPLPTTMRQPSPSRKTVGSRKTRVPGSAASTMMSSRLFDESEPDNLALWALQTSISRAVASPRRRIDFSRFNSFRLEKPLGSFAGTLL